MDRADLLSADADSSDAEMLGMRIRQQRKARGLSIRELAARSTLSIGMISQIEQGKSAPSLRSLRLISEALTVPVSALFVQGRISQVEEQHIVRRDNRPVLKLNDAVRKELLSPPSLHHMEIFHVVLQPGRASSVEAYSHSGEKAGIVISGRLDLWLNDERFELEEGDVCQFAGAIPHRYANNADTVCCVIWVLTPPSA